MSSRDAKTSAFDGGLRKFDDRIKPHPGQPGNKDYEDRRNAAACFKNPAKREDWHPDYVGVLITEDLPAGTKCWVKVRKRISRKSGKPYLSVELRRQEVCP